MAIIHPYSYFGDIMFNGKVISILHEWLRILKGDFWQQTPVKHSLLSGASPQKQHLVEWSLTAMWEFQNLRFAFFFGFPPWKCHTRSTAKLSPNSLCCSSPLRDYCCQRVALPPFLELEVLPLLCFFGQIGLRV